MSFGQNTFAEAPFGAEGSGNVTVGLSGLSLAFSVGSEVVVAGALIPFLFLIYRFCIQPFLLAIRVSLCRQVSLLLAWGRLCQQAVLALYLLTTL